jgi:hypothetical protein
MMPAPHVSPRNTDGWRPDYCDHRDQEYPRGQVVSVPDPTLPRSYRLVSIAILGLTLWALGELGIYAAAHQLFAWGVGR